MPLSLSQNKTATQVARSDANYAALRLHRTALTL